VGVPRSWAQCGLDCRIPRRRVVQRSISSIRIPSIHGARGPIGRLQTTRFATHREIVSCTDPLRDERCR